MVCANIPTTSVELYPKGYPRLAAYIDSDSDTALFRRFGILSARNLLYLQAELTELEARLNALDKADEGEPEPGAHPNRWRLAHSISLNDGQMNVERKELMEKISQKKEVYGTRKTNLTIQW